MPHNNLCYEFGPYQFDLFNRLLKRGDEPVSLTPKATDILGILVRRAGQVVEKDDLLREVWPDTFVEEANLTQQIFALRKALGDERPVPKYIETVTRRGYRFIATVKVIEIDENHLASAGVQGAQEIGGPVNHRPVVAVLPFTNVMSDPEVEYLVQGVTDNIINNLSRISKLRVMSRSAVFRYRNKEIDPQQAGRDLGAQLVLVGKISSGPGPNVIDVELVDTATGWQLWGESFSSEEKDLLEIQDIITRQIVATLKLDLSGDEEKRITARYTENGEAYQSYLEGRHHWSNYTRSGIERAIRHFRNAIELDANYALAYAGIIDCYLRLATNYLPPEGDVPSTDHEAGYQPETGVGESDPRVKLRFEWDWKGAERELRRANELQTTYPTAPQWYAAYKATRQIYNERTCKQNNQSEFNFRDSHGKTAVTQIASLNLTLSEEIQIYCAISREQIDSGNYDAACRILRPWWLFGNWPKLDGLDQKSSADLLFTIGELAGFVASTQQIPRGQRHGEELLIGSITLFEHLGFKRRAAEGRIELALCYYRQGLFDIGRSILIHVLSALSEDDWELRSLALIRLASLERHAGRLREALSRLNEATDMVTLSGPWATGRRHLELASTYKDIAIAEDNVVYFNNAQQFYYKALHEFEAVGNHRYVAIVENNIGFLRLNLKAYQESECHLLRASRLFEAFSDAVRGAQVNETLARLYVATEQYILAHDAIKKAVQILEKTDGEALLAEALATSGLVESKLGNYAGAKSILQASCSVAERCGDYEGAGRALLILLEEFHHQLEPAEKIQISEKITELLKQHDKRAAISD